MRKRRTGAEVWLSGAVRLGAIILLCLTIKRAAPWIDSAAERFFSDGRASAAILSLSAGRILGRGASKGETALDDKSPEKDLTPPVSDDPAPQDVGTPDAPSDEPELWYEASELKEGSFSLISEGIDLYNKTGYEIDVDALLSAPLKFSSKTGAAVLITHTHGSEAYTTEAGWEYEESDPYRTEDRRYSVMRVGEALEAVLESRGVTVFHDDDIYDYPSYTGSYTRSGAAISEFLKKNPNIRVVIDLHRDALEGKDGTVYKTLADVGSKPCSQIMIVAGTNYSGLNHPNWQENMSLALKLQAAMVQEYPSLARPLEITQYRYNQHLTTGSLIVEVGCTGNTLVQSIAAAEYFGDCLCDVLEYDYS